MLGLPLNFCFLILVFWIYIFPSFCVCLYLYCVKCLNLFGIIQWNCKQAVFFTKMQMFENHHWLYSYLYFFLFWCKTVKSQKRTQQEPLFYHPDLNIFNNILPYLFQVLICKTKFWKYIELKFLWWPLDPTGVILYPVLKTFYTIFPKNEIQLPSHSFVLVCQAKGTHLIFYYHMTFFHLTASFIWTTLPDNLGLSKSWIPFMVQLKCLRFHEAYVSPVVPIIFSFLQHRSVVGLCNRFLFSTS